MSNVLIRSFVFASLFVFTLNAQNTTGALVIVADYEHAKKAVDMFLARCIDSVFGVQIQNQTYSDGVRRPAILQLAGTAASNPPAAGDHAGSTSASAVKSLPGPPVAMFLQANNANLFSRCVLEVLCRVDVSIVCWELEGSMHISLIQNLKLDCSVHDLVGVGAPDQGYFPIITLTQTSKEGWKKTMLGEEYVGPVSKGNSFIMVG